MAGITVYNGLDQILTRAYVSGANLTIGLKTNSIGSLTKSSNLASVNAVSGAGYGALTLTNSNWSTTNGALTYDPNPTWTATGTWSAAVTGYYIHDGTYLWHVHDDAAPYTMTSGKKYVVDLSTITI